MEDKQCCSDEKSGGGIVKGAMLFLLFFAIAIGYYLGIDYVLMVFAQNLPFPYKG